MKSFTATVFTVLFALPLLYRMDGAAADSTSCAGNLLCSILPASDCLAAQRELAPGSKYFTGANVDSTGTCSGSCRLAVSGGPLCSLTGAQMITAYTLLRKANCKVCGVYTYSNGCQFVIDYDLNCISQG